jgi:hypothetical protein
MYLMTGKIVPQPKPLRVTQRWYAFLGVLSRIAPSNLNSINPAIWSRAPDATDAISNQLPCWQGEILTDKSLQDEVVDIKVGRQRQIFGEKVGDRYGVVEDGLDCRGDCT